MADTGCYTSCEILRRDRVPGKGDVIRSQNSTNGLILQNDNRR